MLHTTRVCSLFLIATLSFYAAGPAFAFDDTVVARFDYPGWFKQTFFHLGDDLAEAEQGGKRGLALFFSTMGCSYCQRMLRKTFADPVIAERLQADFDVIGLEMFDDAEITDWAGQTQRIKEFAVREGAQFSPTLVFYDLQGRRLLRLVGYYEPPRIALALSYLSESRAGDLDFATWLERRRSAMAASPPEHRSHPRERLLAAPPPPDLNRSQGAAERPLLVIFSADDCGRCERLDRQVLGDPEVRELLADFEVVRLDARDASTPLITPAGVETTAAQWLESLGFTQLPALAWFGERGTPLLRTDALVLKGRLVNALGYVRDRADLQGWTYQRYARSKSIERLQDQDDLADSAASELRAEP